MNHQVILQRRFKDCLGNQDRMNNLKRDLKMIKKNETGSTKFHDCLLEAIEKEMNHRG